jgi:hypothetical protein
MSDPFWYLSQWIGNTVTSEGGVDGSTTSDDGAPTPSTTTATLDDGLRVADTNHHLAGTLLLPEPAVLFSGLKTAVDEMAAVVGRFGPKMAATLRFPHNLATLFTDPKQLQLPSLRYADNFTCELTELYKPKVSLNGEAPLLWWLWVLLLSFLQRSGMSTGFTLDFKPARNTNIALTYTIKIKLGFSKGGGEPQIEMTAAYGGDLMERRIFTAPIAIFASRRRVSTRPRPPWPSTKLRTEVTAAMVTRSTTSCRARGASGAAP